MFKNYCYRLCLTIFLQLSHNEAAKILGLFIYPSYSHQIVFQPIWRELSLRGHNVTVMSPNILNDTSLTNLTEIDISFTYEMVQEENLGKKRSKNNFLIWNILTSYMFLGQLVEAELQHEAVQKLIKDEEEHFDLVVVEGHCPMIYAFGAKFNAPVISITSLTPWLHCHDIMGNPTHPVFPDAVITPDDNFGFAYRLSGAWYNIWSRILYHWYILPKEDRTVKKYFGEDFPYLGDIYKNTSLMMYHANPIISRSRPNVPNVIEINQLHIREKKPLPEDLQAYLDSSTRGVVYFSFGTNINSRHVSPKMLNLIIQGLSELPYNVVWKYDTENITNKPDNFLVRKWLPQQDLLGHPNVKVFFTQGGLQSAEEAILNEVPMVGIPFIADQPRNLKNLADRGVAIVLNLETMTKEDLKRAISEVAENRQYKQRVIEAAEILREQPMKGVEKAVYWIEYVLRFKGAKHLRSPAADMPLYQYFMVDVVLVLFVSCYLGVFAIKKMFSIINFNVQRRKLKIK